MLTTALHARLPAELRCNTCHYVIDEGTTTSLTSDLVVRTNHYFESRPGILSCCQIKDVQDVTLDFASMDQQVAREIVGQLYTTITHEGLSIQQLPAYLQADLFFSTSAYGRATLRSWRWPYASTWTTSIIP
jgi:hypothetical protein